MLLVTDNAMPAFHCSLEQRTLSSSWMENSTTDYTSIVVSYTSKVAAMLILLCVDIGFNSSVDHDLA